LKLQTLRLLGISRALLAAALVSLAGIPVADTLHQLEHLREDRSPAGTVQAQAKPICQVCAAFSAIGHALPPRLSLELMPQGVQASDLPPALRPVARHFHAYLERAPPALLAGA
jgi:hypothetical protein